MERLSREAEEILIERFGKDSIIALATSVGETPYVRNVNAFYSDGAFYVLTYGLSNKMKQIELAVCSFRIAKRFKKYQRRVVNI